MSEPGLQALQKSIMMNFKLKPKDSILDEIRYVSLNGDGARGPSPPEYRVKESLNLHDKLLQHKYNTIEKFPLRNLATSL